MSETERAAWRRSSYSEQQCVEVGPRPAGARAVRDSKHPAGPVLTFGAAAWAAFVEDLHGPAGH
ncbi:DUF397 domain-containing protein [Streptomyces sp. NPDC048357]|uniref:DUF397 domain-containing protein n=1 Tax=Streptomyces sp. NPDC048357 TaxID=3154719 RepID=UPI00341871DF